MKISAIDIGSNSVRLAVCDGGNTLYKRIITTRLGANLAATGELCAQSVENTVTALCKFKAEAQSCGCEKIYVFATEAVRSAKNRDGFLSRVKAECGLDIEVLNGEEEALCGVLGALGGGDGGIIDVGGASTEVTVRKSGKTVYSKSVKMGAVRLYDVAGRNEEELNRAIDKLLDGYGEFSARGVNMYAIGGTATTLASVKHGLKVYDPKITHGTRFTAEEVRRAAHRFLSLTVDEVRAVDGMDIRRADVIGGGALALARVMEKLEIAEITVSENDNLEGFLALKEGWK